MSKTAAMFVIQFVLLLLIFESADNSKILCVFPFPSPSHQFMLQTVSEELSLRGHQVTVITPNPRNATKLVNLTEIDVSFAYQIIPRTNFDKFINGTLLEKLIFMTDWSLEIMEEQLAHKPVKNLIKNNSNFDLVIVQLSFVYNILNLGFAALFGAPPYIGKYFYCIVCF